MVGRGVHRACRVLQGGREPGSARVRHLHCARWVASIAYLAAWRSCRKPKARTARFCICSSGGCKAAAGRHGGTGRGIVLAGVQARSQAFRGRAVRAAGTLCVAVPTARPPVTPPSSSGLGHRPFSGHTRLNPVGGTVCELGSSARGAAPGTNHRAFPASLVPVLDGAVAWFVSGGFHGRGKHSQVGDMLCERGKANPRKHGPVEQSECSPPCQGGGRGFKSRQDRSGWRHCAASRQGQVAQSVRASA